jgi:hypothetical protein
MLSELVQPRNRERPSQLEQVVRVDKDETAKIMYRIEDQVRRRSCHRRECGEIDAALAPNDFFVQRHNPDGNKVLDPRRQIDSVLGFASNEVAQSWHRDRTISSTKARGVMLPGPSRRECDDHHKEALFLRRLRLSAAFGFQSWTATLLRYGLRRRDLPRSETALERRFIGLPWLNRAHHSVLGFIVHHSNFGRPTSATGQTRPCGHLGSMSVLPEGGHG